MDQEQRVEASVEFPDGAIMRYQLVQHADLGAIHAGFDDGTLEVGIPVAEVTRLQADDVITIAGNCELSDGESLRVTIEKDFQCLTPRDEDESKLFANPRAGSGH